MTNKPERRRALRIVLNAPTLVEVIGQPEIKLHANLERVYTRVEASKARVGDRFPGVIRDLSTNGAFIAGEALPLLSRVAFTFPLENYGQIEVLGWTLWSRAEECEIPREDQEPVILPAGFGVLFEAIPLDARIAIHDLVNQS